MTGAIPELILLEFTDCGTVGKKLSVIMLKWSLIFLVVAVIAALFGFTGIAGAATEIARFLFFLFVGIFVLMLILGLFLGSKV